MSARLISILLEFPVKRPMLCAKGRRLEVAGAVFFACFIFIGSTTGAVALDQTNPAIVQALDEYEACLENAVSKAASMKTAKLRQKVFHGKSKGCERKLAAELSIAREQQLQADLRSETSWLVSERDAAKREIAQITDSLIADAKRDLGL